MPSLVVLDLRNSCSLRIRDYVRGAHCSFWFLNLAGYIWQKPEWDSSPASVNSRDARSTDALDAKYLGCRALCDLRNGIVDLTPTSREILRVLGQVTLPL